MRYLNLVIIFFILFLILSIVNKTNQKRTINKKKGYIYLINCKTEKGFNKYYIGQTFQNPTTRLEQHYKAKSSIGIALRKTKKSDIKFEILERGFYTHKELNELEAKYIDKYNSYEFGYNETSGNCYKKFVNNLKK